jgi:autotransporter-associated beta strand protein
MSRFVSFSRRVLRMSVLMFAAVLGCGSASELRAQLTIGDSFDGNECPPFDPDCTGGGDDGGGQTGGGTFTYFITVPEGETQVFNNGVGTGSAAGVIKSGAGTLLVEFARINGPDNRARIEEGFLALTGPGSIVFPTPNRIVIAGGWLVIDDPFPNNETLHFPLAFLGGGIQVGAGKSFYSDAVQGSVIKSGSGTFLVGNGMDAATVREGTLAQRAGGFVSGGVNVFAGATFDVGAGGRSFGGLLGAGTFTFGADPITISIGGSNASFSGLLDGTGRIEINANGAGGTQAFSGASAEALDFLVTSGTLRLGNETAPGTFSGTYTLGSGGNLSFGGNQHNWLDGLVTGEGALRVTGEATLGIRGNNVQHTGGTFVDGGQLLLADGGSLGGQVTVAHGATFLVETATGFSGNVAISESGTFSLSLSDDFTLATNRFSGSGQLRKLGGNALTLTGSLDGDYRVHLEGGSLVTNEGGTFGGVTGNGIWHKQGDDDVSLTGELGGAVIVGGGNVSLGDAEGRGGIFNAAMTMSNGGQLIFNRTGTTVHTGGLSGTAEVRHEGAGTSILTGNFTHTGGTSIVSGALQVGNGGTSGSHTGNVAISEGAALAFNRSDDFAFGAETAVSGAGQLRQAGSGSLVLNSTPGHTGGTFVDAGTLVVSGTGGLGGQVTVGDGATLLVQTGHAFTGNTELLAGGMLRHEGSGNAAIDGLITGEGSVVKATGNELYLSGANTFSGGLTVDSGRVVLEHPTAAGSGTVTLNHGSGLLTLGGAFQIGNAINVTNSAGESLIGVGPASGAGDFLGDLVLNGPTMLANYGNDRATFVGEISGNVGLLRIGAGRVTMHADNSFVGDVEVLPGAILQLNSGANAPIPHSSAMTNNGTIWLGSDRTTFAGLSGTGTVTTIFGENRALVLNHADDHTFSGAINDGNGILSLEKVGTGSATFSGNLSHTGGTLIEGGSLILSGNGSLAGNVVVNHASAALIFGLNYDTTFAGDVSGVGQVQKWSPGTVVVTGDWTHSGGTVVHEHTLQIGDGGETGSISGNIAVAASAALRIDRSNRYDISASQTINGAGRFEKAGTGDLVVLGTLDAGGGTIIEEGRVQIGNGGSQGYIGGNVEIREGATLAMNLNTTQYLAANLSGGGELVKDGDNYLLVLADAHHTGGSVVNGGFLQIGGFGGTPYGSITGDVVLNAGSLVFARSTDLTYGGNVSGGGQRGEVGPGHDPRHGRLDPHRRHHRAKLCPQHR